MPLEPAKLIRRIPNGVWQISAFVFAGLIVIMFATGWTRWEGNSARQTTDDAYLQSEITSISAKVPGYVRAVRVQDYERVRSGQIIAEVVDDDYRATVAQSEANVALAEAQVRTLEAQQGLQAAVIRAAQAALAATTANVKQSVRDLLRASELAHNGGGSAEAQERADTRRAQLLADQAQNHAQVEAAQQQLIVLVSQIGQAKAALEAQRANLALARINLGYTVIRAPQDGLISQRQAFPGQYVAVGGQVTTLTPLPRLWVIANYRETQLTRVAIGQRATVTVDTYPGRSLKGHVVALAPASGAQFALLPPDNATGNFTKIVQRFGVKIAIDDSRDLADQLRPGMSVIATIDADSKPQKPLLGAR
jgi:membrane fusion protein (multidrug efflux system)